MMLTSLMAMVKEMRRKPVGLLYGGVFGGLLGEDGGAKRLLVVAAGSFFLFNVFNSEKYCYVLS